MTIGHKYIDNIKAPLLEVSPEVSASVGAAMQRLCKAFYQIPVHDLYATVEAPSGVVMVTGFGLPATHLITAYACGRDEKGRFKRPETIVICAESFSSEPFIEIRSDHSEATILPWLTGLIREVSENRGGNT